jgi:adenylate kinase family enzyme
VGIYRKGDFMIILIIGESGSGKTRSCKNLAGAAILQCLPKRLPFRTAITVCATESLEKLEQALKRALASERDVFVIDDFQFLKNYCWNQKKTSLARI